MDDGTPRLKELLVRHPLYASWVAFLLMVIAIAAFSRGGDVVLAGLAIVGAAGLSVALYGMLSRDARGSEPSLGLRSHVDDPGDIPEH